MTCRHCAKVCALTSTVGQPKARVLEARCRDVNPDALEVDVVLDFVDHRTVDDALFGQHHVLPDVVVDAIDGVDDKVAILEACAARDVPVVCVGGAGGRADPTAVRVSRESTLHDVAGDGLLRAVRKRWRRRASSSDAAAAAGHDDKRVVAAAVFSTEAPLPPPADSLKRTGCDQGFGTAAFVTGAFGFAAAKAAVDLVLRASSRGEPGDDDLALRGEGRALNDNSSRSSSSRRSDDDEEPEPEDEFVELDCPCSDFDS